MVVITEYYACSVGVPGNVRQALKPFLGGTGTPRDTLLYGRNVVLCLLLSLHGRAMYGGGLPERT